MIMRVRKVVALRPR